MSRDEVARQAEAEVGPWVETLTRFCRQEVDPHAHAWDGADGFPGELVTRLGAQGLLGVRVPETQGGAGASWRTTVALSEVLGASCGALGAAIAVHDELCIAPVAAAGVHGALEELLAPAALAGWGRGDAGSGSPVRAQPNGATWELSGTLAKVIGGLQGWLVLVAEGPQGPTLFAMPPGSPGRSPGAQTTLLGLRGLGLGAVHLAGVQVPDGLRLGPHGGALEALRGFEDALTLRIAAVACGLGKGALARAVAYAQEREQFGQPIAKFQAIQWKLADAHTRLAAAHLAVDRGASQWDGGARSGPHASRAALLALPEAIAACSEALQIHGGYGYTRDFPIERMLRDARTCALLTGGEVAARTRLAGAIAERFGS